MVSPSPSIKDSVPLINLSNEMDSIKVCKHCLQPCTDEVVFDNEGTFCCTGCLAVFKLINNNGLCDYYNLEEVSHRPSLKLNHLSSSDYQWLNNQEVAAELGVIHQNGISNLEFHCPSIHCASCLYLLDNLHKFNKGITKSEARFNDRKVSIWYKAGEVELSELASILTQLGYTPKFESSEDAALNKSQVNRVASNRLLTRLGVAGFAAGNTMMLSFPAYFGLDSDVFSQFDWIFPTLNIVLASLAVGFSASDWFVRSYRDISHKKLSVDVPIAMAIGVLFFRSLTDVFLNTGPGFFDSLCGLIFLLLIGQWLQTRYYEGLEFEHTFSSFFPLTATLVESDSEKQVLLKNLKPKDRIRLKAHELVPADSVVVYAEHCLADHSCITGESQPKPLIIGEKVFAGTRLLTGKLELEVLKAPNQSWLNRLWNQAAEDSQTKAEPALFERLFVKYFTFLTLIIAFSVLIFWLSYNPAIAFNAFTAVLMVACPCAVTLAMPFSFNRALNHLAKSGFYARNAAVVESLAQINHWVFDKTGTLTQPQLNLSNQGNWYPNKQLLEAPDQELINHLVVKSAELGSHPLLWELAQSLRKVSTMPQAKIFIQDFQEIPGKGIIINTTDLGEIKIGSAKFIGAQTQTRDLSSEIAISINGRYQGSFRVGHTLREGAQKVISSLSGAKTILTGDNESGTSLFKELSGINTETTIKWNQSPDEKKSYIQALKNKGITVMMIGDGLNDSPAMKAATVSLALIERENGFSPSADCITKANNLKYLPEWVRFSKSTLSMVKIALGLSVIYNFVGVGLAVSGQLSPLFAAVFMPLSSLSVVALGVLLTDYQAKKIFRTSM